jgi:SAM-dependent methyltransferase
MMKFFEWKKTDIPFLQDLLVPVTLENFNEVGYLSANPDVMNAVKKNQFKSGRTHFEKFGFNENRFQRFSVDQKIKNFKLNALSRIINTDYPHKIKKNCFDFLNEDLKTEFGIQNTDLISSNEYDTEVLELIQKHRDGIILDCGAGSRNKYFKNVVNLEIVEYPSTDVLAVGERLPFTDNSFDAVISIAVLEHVKYPWICAREIVRVLKPGGDLICCVPFLQPLHGYPHHYYNMTAQGLQSLFSPDISIKKHEVPASTSPIWMLTWILESWANDLTKKTKDEFLNLKISDLIQKPHALLNSTFVTELSDTKNFELASATVLHGTKINK